jgi:hypothetical protein
MEVRHIWRDFRKWKVIHAFVEWHMEGNFDSIGVGITPQRMFLVVFGRHPRKIPQRALFLR